MTHRLRGCRLARVAAASLLLAFVLATAGVVQAGAGTAVGVGTAAARVSGGKGSTSGGASSLEHAAKNATSATRSIVGQLIAIALCAAAAILVFKRDFAEAAAVFVVGMLALLLVDPAGVSLLKGTVKQLFGH